MRTSSTRPRPSCAPYSPRRRSSSPTRAEPGGAGPRTMKLKLDLHDVYNKGHDIDRALLAIIDEAEAKKAPLVEIIPGKGSGQLKKRVLRFLDQPEIKARYHRVEKDSHNFGRGFVHFRWKEAPPFAVDAEEPPAQAGGSSNTRYHQGPVAKPCSMRCSPASRAPCPARRARPSPDRRPGSCRTRDRSARRPCTSRSGA